jgi:hypothetical protein
MTVLTVMTVDPPTIPLRQEDRHGGEGFRR